MEHLLNFTKTYVEAGERSHVNISHWITIPITSNHVQSHPNHLKSPEIISNHLESPKAKRDQEGSWRNLDDWVGLAGFRALGHLGHSGQPVGLAPSA